MNLKKIALFVTLFIPFLLNAQATNTSSNDDFKCGISEETAALIKQRLMANRQLFTRQEVVDLVSNRAITYVPVTIHNVAANASGLGKTSEQTILAFLCGLNAIYADQDVQFFMHGPIRDRISNNIYTNAGTSTSRNQMLSYRVSNTLNLIIGASTTNPTASWYDRNGDFVFLLQQMLTSAAKTEAHEIGHFFTLPHTFYGWEGNTVNTTYPSGVLPSCTISGGFFSHTPERVARTGPRANCQTAADGFCDTPADYFSSRLNCPFPAFSDCDTVPLTPDESNIMSYAFDACVTTFSPEQEAAIAMDIATRTWATNTPPTTTDITGLALPVSPLSGAQLGDINNSTVLLEWTPVTGATMYYVEVYGTQFPGLWYPNVNDPIYKGISYTTNPQFNLSTANLVAGSRYAWRIKAINSLSTCASFGSYATFEATTGVTTGLKDLPIEKQMSFSANANPITTSSIAFSVYSAEDVVGSIKIYSIDGREVLSLTKQEISTGDSMIQLPADGLENGLYVAILVTDRGQLQQKIILQR
ncbi:MAG: Metalloprotease [uncultured Aureispira sp.]|uniref:Metalloprotease n=1 Tax=uncultured Aureispira sp. TaxID=1331704 RepID=A0A6S6TBD0_9BACT|nr:MAG: Metalloprotease [uncultured Aureispira sp.]